MKKMNIERFHLMVNNKSKRIQELVYENTYHVYDVPHVGMNELIYQVILETIDKMEEAQDSGFSPDKYVLEHFGIKLWT